MAVEIESRMALMISSLRWAWVEIMRRTRSGTGLEMRVLLSPLMMCS